MCVTNVPEFDEAKQISSHDQGLYIMDVNQDLPRVRVVNQLFHNVRTDTCNKFTKLRDKDLTVMI